MSYGEFRTGSVFWITGLSGVGKTTVARLLQQKLIDADLSVILLDGDDLRAALGHHFGHSIEERQALSLFYARLCQLISSQGTHVICSTISLFHKTHEWNRKNLNPYYEIYLKAPIDELHNRDPKKIYENAMSQQDLEVAGIHWQIEEPLNPDLIIENHGDNSAEKTAEEIFRFYLHKIN